MAPTNVLTSDFARYPIADPKEFNKTLGYSACNFSRGKGPDTRPSSRSSMMTFRKDSSLPKEVL